MAPVDPERARRLPLWVALSDLFLDTEVRWFLPRAAWQAVQAGYSWPEVDHILRQEVAPAVGSNLFDVAGEWCGFPEDYLVSRIERLTMVDKAQGLASCALMKRMFAALEHLYRYLRVHPEGEREMKRLDALAHLYIDRHWPGLAGMWNHFVPLVTASREALEVSRQDGLEPALAPLRCDRDATPAEFAANWRWLLLFHGWCRTQPVSPSQLMRICEHLSGLYRVDRLVGSPVGKEAESELPSWNLSAAQLEAIFRGPMADLYPDRHRVERNWRELRSVLFRG